MKSGRIIKNTAASVAGICGLLLAATAILIPPQTLATLIWRRAVFDLAVIAAGAVVIQFIQQSRDDADLSSKLDSVLAARGITPERSATPIEVDESPTQLPHPLQASSEIDGEVYRIAINARSSAWVLVRDLYKLQNREDEAVIDTDILVELYLVNCSSEQTRYVRDLFLSAEVAGKEVQFVRQNDLLAIEFNGTQYEYGLHQTKLDVAQPLKQLSGTWPITLAPQQPTEGWVRFTAKSINPDKVVSGTIKLTLEDSLGNKSPIHRIAEDRERKGEVGLRRHHS